MNHFTLEMKELQFVGEVSRNSDSLARKAFIQFTPLQSTKVKG